MRRAAPVLLALLVAGAAGCGKSKTASTRITSDTLSIYTSLPLRGERADDGRAVLRGEKLALEEAGGRVGDVEIGLKALDDTRTSSGRWDPKQASENAKQAAEDPTTIAYIGDLDSGASAVSVPITNATGVLQVSPLSTYTGLTQAADKGEPAKYYPSGRRTFARLVPPGSLEARTLAAWVSSKGFQRVTLAYDGFQEGLGQASELERALQAAGVEVLDVIRIDAGGQPPDVTSEARDIARAPAGAMVYAGASVPAAATLIRAVHQIDPGVTYFVTSGVARAGLAASVDSAERQVNAISPLLPVDRRPAAAQRVADRYQELFGAPAPAAALYGYEAMRTVLDAIERAKDGKDRRSVIDAYLATSATDSVIGTYAIGKDGDTTATGYGAYRVTDGRLRFEHPLVAAAN